MVGERVKERQQQLSIDIMSEMRLGSRVAVLTDSRLKIGESDYVVLQVHGSLVDQRSKAV